nr:increased DNA methylation 1 isoform X2 [Ipomoea batatas]
MKLDSDVALEDVRELADSEVQIRDVQEQESGVDNLADGVNEEINGTTSIAAKFSLSNPNFPNSHCLYTLNLSLVLNIRCFLSLCCVGFPTPPTVAPMKLDSDVALEAVHELADSEVQI